MSLGTDWVIDWVRASAAVIAENRVELITLDREIGDGDHTIRWIAADPERSGCAFGVSLAPGGGEAVPVIRATVGSGVDRGTLQPQTFDALDVRGAVFATVTSDCDWALVVSRVPDAEPSPSDGG